MPSYHCLRYRSRTDRKTQRDKETKGYVSPLLFYDPSYSDRKWKLPCHHLSFRCIMGLRCYHCYLQFLTLWAWTKMFWSFSLFMPMLSSQFLAGLRLRPGWGIPEEQKKKSQLTTPGSVVFFDLPVSIAFSESSKWSSMYLSRFSKCIPWKRQGWISWFHFTHKQNLWSFHYLCTMHLVL